MKFTYPSELPVSAARDDIAKAVSSSQVVIVSGQTGSGKTTQLPKILLELGRGTHGRQIVHTQPRRLAARTVAERIASEMGVHLGDEIGYQVRFTDETSPKTRLRVVTDGILLAQIQRDPQLRQYDTIVIDEAHERSLNIDFLLGYLTALPWSCAVPAGAARFFSPSSSRAGRQASWSLSRPCRRSRSCGAKPS